MKRALILAAAPLVAILLGGCTTPYGEPNNAGTGALVGGVSGAGLGALVTRGHPAGALIGAAAGAITGGLVGESVDQQARGPVYVAPPPPPRYVWLNGQWAWNGYAWVWMPGHWVAMP